jgi:NAD(P)-dependent dehydrogenase (short-subunit alcohol dehydrogenase family)
MAKVALVTGAGQSVGRGISEVLAQSGFAIAVNDLHPDRAESVVEAIRAVGGRAAAVPFDCTDPDAIRHGVAAIAAELGPVDVLVNNAGIAEDAAPPGPFLESDPASWAAQFNLNLFGSMHCIQAVGPGMVERGWGRIIQISSGASSTGLAIGVSLYGAAKAGIEGLLRHLATELGPTGVTVNALALGLMENVDKSEGTDPRVMSLTKGVPVRRFGRATEIGAAVRWLSSDEGAFVTGQVIHVNGGALNGR